MSERKPVIVTFKPKDQRPDRHTDKLDIMRSALVRGTRAHFFDAATLGACRASIEEQVIGYDINRYEAPIVSAQLTESEIQTLRENANVAKVEDDGICHALGFGPYEHLKVKDKPWSVTKETIPDGVQQVNAPDAWSISMGNGIRVGILDTGIDFDHPDLQANYKGGTSLVKGAPTPMDDNKQGHGTHCAGTIAAVKNGAGVIGVAPQASLYAVKVLDRDATGLFSWSIAGIDWCIQQKLNIISMSLGCECVPTAMHMMCKSAWSNGLLILSGAGNQDDTPSPPYESSVDYPAKYKDVIAVSSIDSSNVIAPTSARGSEVDLCAPGVDILSTVPNNGYRKLSGTSAACPHVSGVAALIWAAHPSSTNQDIWNLLASTVVNLGIPDRDPTYGYGRVNAVAAVNASLPPPWMRKAGI